MTSRSPFCNQRLLYMLLHATRKDQAGIEMIRQAIEEMLIISGGLVGAPRIPGFGMGLLQEPFLQVCKLHSVKSSIDLILKELRNINNLDFCTENREIQSLLGLALPYIIADADAFRTTESSLKIVLISWDDPEIILPAINRFMSTFDSRCLVTLKVYCVEYTEGSDILASHLGCQISPAIETPSGVTLESESLPLDPYSLIAVFKECLGEESGETPHLVLSFGKEDTKMIVSLDFKESAIDPSLLPSVISSKLTLQQNTVKQTSTTTGSFIHVPGLEVLHRSKISSISSLWLTDQPIYLVPSAAKSLAFEDFWENSQKVNAIVKSLEEQQEVLICRSTVGGQIAVHSYVVIYSARKGLVMSHILPLELTLMEKLGSSYAIPPSKYQEEAKNALNCLEQIPFRIEDLKSNLTSALFSHQTKYFKNRNYQHPLQARTGPPACRTFVQPRRKN